VDLFRAQFPSSAPGSIEIVSQPAENDLRAFIISSKAPIVNQIVNNTIRVVKVINGPMPLGNRVFQFKVTDNNNLGQFTAPAAPTISSTDPDSGTLADATYFYSVSALFAEGESIVSTEVSQAVGNGGNNNTITIAFTVPAGATKMIVYRRLSSATTRQKLAEVTAPTATYADTGAATPQDIQPKTTNVTLTVAIT
jgi:hypothetical protein